MVKGNQPPAGLAAGGRFGRPRVGERGTRGWYGLLGNRYVGAVAIAIKLRGWIVKISPKGSEIGRI
jgi:hypothetical protein